MARDPAYPQEGSVEGEPLLARQPDLIVSWIWDKNNPASSQVAIPEDLTDQVAGMSRSSS